VPVVPDDPEEPSAEAVGRPDVPVEPVPDPGVVEPTEPDRSKLEPLGAGLPKPDWVLPTGPGVAEPRG